MDAIVQGLVIPRITFVGEIIDYGPDMDHAYTKRFIFYVWVGEKVFDFVDDEKGKLCEIRQGIINKINYYYSDVAYQTRVRKEGEF